MSDTPIAADQPEVIPPGGPPADDNLPGMTLGDYVVEKAVAWGGMGIVYRAVHPLIGRSVAVKVLRPNFASDPEQMSRFLKEAQAISAIKHRGIIDIIGFGKLPMPDGRQYMVMEFLDGESLEAVMNREGAMTPWRVLTIIDEVLDALSAAHKVGVVHRDLKPSNVYITEQSNGSRYVKLVDFGLARRASITDLNRASGKASLMAGTPEYLSPEQAKGLAATPRTDLYCLGAMMFEMVTGRLPFIADSVIEMLGAHLNTPAPRVSTLVNGVPPALDDLIAQLLLKPPELRPSSADAARQTVVRILRQLKDDATQIGGRAPPLVAIPKGMAAPGSEEETTRRSMKKTGEMAPRLEERTAIVSERTLLPPERNSAARERSTNPKPGREETTRMPAIGESKDTSKLAQVAHPVTQPNFGARPWWIPAAVVAAVVAILGAGAIVVWPSHAPTVGPEHVLPSPPPDSFIVAAPPIVTSPVAIVPERTPDKVEKVDKPDDAAPKPVRPVVRVARSEPKPEPLPSVCEEKDWKAKLQGTVGQLEQAYLRKVGSKASPEAVNELRAFDKKLAGAKTIADCGTVGRGVQGWRKKHLE